MATIGRRVTTCLGALAMAWGAAVHARGEDAGPVREIPLGELGLDAGLTVSARDGAALHFPVGEGAAIASLEIDIPFTAPDDWPAGTRLLLVGSGKAIASRDIAAGESGTWQVAVPTSAVSGSTLPLRLTLADKDGAPACHAAIGTARLVLGRDMALRARYRAGVGRDLASALRHAPSPLLLTLPERPGESQVAAALRIASARPVRFGADDGGGPWRRTSVRFLDTDGPVRLEDGATPAFRVGRDHAVAAVSLFADGAPTSAPAVLPAAAMALAQPGGSIALADLPGGKEARTISDRGGWTFYLPSHAIPSGRSLSALSFGVALGRDGGNGAVTATLALNGEVLAARAIAAGETGRLAADVPKGLAATTNRIDISIQRRERADDCDGAVMGQRARLLSSSHVVLDEANTPSDFADLPAAFAGGVTLVVPGGVSGGEMGALARLMTGMIGAATPLAVRYGGWPETGPVIWISATPPPVAGAPIPMDRHGARIRDAEGRVVLAQEELSRLTAAQLFESAGRPVLWIRPGEGFAQLADLPAGAELSYGDVAFFGAGSRVFALHSVRERSVGIDYAGDFDLREWFDANRIWLVLAAWAAISALFAWLLRQTARARRHRLEGEADA